MSTLADLRRITVFADLADAELAWLADQAETVTLAPGDAIVHEGDPAEAMFAIVEGELQARTEKGPSDGRVIVVKAGTVSGMLPFSRLTRFPVTSRAVLPTRLLRIPKGVFPEMLHRIPSLEPRLVAALAERVRDGARDELHRETLMALGKLAAGLAHELNNPAAAARRAAGDLHELLTSLPGLTIRLAAHGLEERGIEALSRLVARTMDGEPRSSAGPLARAEREEELAGWLGEHGVGNAWRLAETLAAVDLSPTEIMDLADGVPESALGDAIACVAVLAATGDLAGDVETAVGRISELVAAVRSYSDLDRAPTQVPTDIHLGLESTLMVLGDELRRKRIAITRAYAPELPPVPGRGAELNQVWTNLIDNAIGAMAEGGRLTIRTACEPTHVLVEIGDDGPGIAPGDQARIWEPFFTTKDVGKGTGLGLDIARRIIVRRHGGEIRVDSRPGDTRFQVRLPLEEVPPEEPEPAAVHVP